MRIIDTHKGRFGVAPICRVLSEHGLKIAPSTYYDAKDKPASKCALRDEQLKAPQPTAHRPRRRFPRMSEDFSPGCQASVEIRSARTAK